MARNKSDNKDQGGAREHFMFPKLHQDVSNKVSRDVASTWFNESDGDDFKKQYPTNVMGKFTCSNGNCLKSGWSSKKVAIRIRGYRNNGYSAIVFNQRCDSCKQLGNMILDEASYVDRVSFRIKKWAGVSVETPCYGEEKGLPHKEELCEGCKQGYCKKGMS